MRLRSSVIGQFAICMLLGCAARGLSSPHGAVPAGTSSRGATEVFPMARLVRPDDERCRGGAYDAFDFWVGSWDAAAVGTTGLAGTNVITRETDGCTIEEHWTDPRGNRGRSLNAYDAMTGRWYQLWMEQSGGGLQFDGTSGRRSMQLSGTHRASRTDSTLLTERVTWTASGTSVVGQRGELSTAGGPFSTVYDITYHRVAAPTAISPAAVAVCSSPDRPRYHAFDFVLGSWTLRAAGVTQRARSVISTDLDGCLIEERIADDSGYRAVAYSGFRPTTFVWNWMFVDNRGMQLRLSGPATLTGSNMVLTGQRTERSGAVVDVRVEWAVVDATTVEQRWSFSSDGGTTWSTPTVVTMTK